MYVYKHICTQAAGWKTLQAHSIERAFRLLATSRVEEVTMTRHARFQAGEERLDVPVDLMGFEAKMGILHGI
jgi:hypothetical protein